MSKDGQGTKWRRRNAENFKRLSRVHERYRQTDRQTTDGRAIAKSRSLSRSLRTLRLNLINTRTDIETPGESIQRASIGYLFQFGAIWRTSVKFILKIYCYGLELDGNFHHRHTVFSISLLHFPS